MGIYWPVIVCGIVLIVVLGIKVYWEILLAFFPRRERAAEVHTVTTKDMWEISLFRYRRGRSSGEPVLLLHGAGANHHNFTEPEGACLVDELVARGYDCWALDMRVCGTAKPAFERKREDATLDDVLLYDLPAVIRYIRKATSYGRVHWVGHSLGGMMLYAYSQQWGTAHIASGTTLGSPIGFAQTKFPFKRVPWLTRQHPRAAANVLRALVPVFFFTGVRSLIFPINIKNLHVRMRPANLFHLIEDPMPKAVDQLLTWAHTKKWTMLGGKLDVGAGLHTLDLPIFALFAARDPFVERNEALNFFKALPNPDKRIAFLSKEDGCQQDYGHCDLAFGADGPRMVNEPIARWIEAHPINERVRAEEIAEDDEPVHIALGTAQRAEILAGVSYAHLATSSPAPKAATIAAPAPEPEQEPTPIAVVVDLVEVVAVVDEPVVAKPAVAKHVAKPKHSPAKSSKPAPKAKAKAKATTKAAPAKAKPAPAKPIAKSAAKTKAKPVAKSAPKPAAKPTAKAAPKPAPKPKAVPAKKAAARPAPKPKPTPKPAPKPAPKAKQSTATPRVTLPPAKATKQKPSLLTKSAIFSAGEALRSLETKKKS